MDLTTTIAVESVKALLLLAAFPALVTWLPAQIYGS